MKAKNKAQALPSGSMSLREFLAREGLTYAQLRTMRKNKTAPKEKRLSAKNIRITNAEYEKWLRSK